MTINPNNTVYVLMIEHKHGVNTYVHRTPEGARASLLAYVTEWWGDTTEKYNYTDQVIDMPADSEEAITLYFDIVEDESYWLDQTEVQP